MYLLFFVFLHLDKQIIPELEAMAGFSSAIFQIHRTVFESSDIYHQIVHDPNKRNSKYRGRKTIGNESVHGRFDRCLHGTYAVVFLCDKLRYGKAMLCCMMFMMKRSYTVKMIIR